MAAFGINELRGGTSSSSPRLFWFSLRSTQFIPAVFFAFCFNPFIHAVACWCSVLMFLLSLVWIDFCNVMFDAAAECCSTQSEFSLLVLALV